MKGKEQHLYQLEKAGMHFRHEQEVQDSKIRMMEMLLSSLHHDAVFSKNEKQKLKNKIFEILDGIDFTPDKFKKELLIEKNK